jgi:hypothetical protein
MVACSALLTPSSANALSFRPFKIGEIALGKGVAPTGLTKAVSPIRIRANLHLSKHFVLMAAQAFLIEDLLALLRFVVAAQR